MTARRILLTALAAAGAIGAIAAVVSRRSRPAGRRMHRSRLRRNGQLARMGARVGTTYATTAARKTFASAQRRDELDRTASCARPRRSPRSSAT